MGSLKNARSGNGSRFNSDLPEQRHGFRSARIHAAVLMPVGDQNLYSTHCIPQSGIAGAVSEIAVEITAGDDQRRAALIPASRSPVSTGDPVVVRVIIFSAHERRLYEKELVTALRAAEESEVRRAEGEKKLQRLALQDALTGLPNRTGLKAELDQRHSGGLAEGDSRLAALFIDLDHVKAVNDSLGHGFGADSGDSAIVGSCINLAAWLDANDAANRPALDDLFPQTMSAATRLFGYSCTQSLWKIWKKKKVCGGILAR